MATPNIQTHANPAAVHAAVLPASVTQPAQPSFAARRSFKSFVEAMDDFGGDRRDVAGMRQMLAMQAENQRLAAARAAAPAVSSFAPDRTEPEVPVVRGPARDSALPRPSPASVLPSLPAAAPVQTGTLPSLPPADAGTASAAAPVPMLVIDPDKIAPVVGAPGTGPATSRILAYAPMRAGAPVQPAAEPAGGDHAEPPQLRSPLVDQMREVTRSGPRPGLSDETMARFAAAAERRRTLSAPMPPRLQAQEARWNRDAWPATVSTARPATPRAAVPQPTVAAAAEARGILPRLPTATSVE